MAQRRNSSGRNDELSDLDDVKALAAKARQETGGPVLKPNAAELSGLRPRRDSVVGMRLTPPPRATSSELPNWFWGVLGCLSVLLVGFAALFLLGRAGTLGPLLGEAASLAAPAPAPPAPAPVVPAAAPSPEPVVKEPERAAPAAHVAERPAHEGHAAAVERAVSAERAAPPEPVAAAPAPENAAPGPAPEAVSAEKRAPPSAAGARARASKTAEPVAAADQDDSAGEAAEAKAPAARATRAAAPVPKAAAADDSDDQDSLPGQDDVERALDALSSKVRGCFVKYQIKGTARVRLVAMPAGKADAVNVTGDFEDTPTGLCVEAVINDAKLPTFKGPPLKLSQSYQLR
jgi:hypothetical protein